VDDRKGIWPVKTECLFVGGRPGLAGTRMSPFWILLELRLRDVVVTTGAIRRSKFQSNRLTAA